jgi:hypothetical protein
MGERLSLSEIQQLVEDDPELQNLSEEHHKMFIDNLLESRILKQSGARVSNVACTRDTRGVMGQINVEVCFFVLPARNILTLEELENLSEHVGSYGFAFIMRGHVHDSSIPGWVESNDSIRFFREVLDLDPLDVATKFEQWACTRDKCT